MDRMDWRGMVAADLAGVERVAATVHPEHPEDGAVFAERLRLFPAGCLVLEGGAGLLGYVVAHPWRSGAPPRLNTLLGRLPAGADVLHVHDLALMAGAQGGGFGGQAVGLLVGCAVAAGLGRMSLVAVGGSAGFWARQGFVAVAGAGAGLGSYGDAVSMVRGVGQ